jgi:hypothetical protein
MGMSDEQRKSYIAALIEERDGYLASGKADRAAEVDAELSRMGEGGSAPAARAEKRPRTRKTKADGETR